MDAFSLYSSYFAHVMLGVRFRHSRTARSDGRLGRAVPLFAVRFMNSEGLSSWPLRSLKDCGKAILRRAVVPLQAAFGNRNEHQFGILTYHRVTEPIRGVAAPTYHVSPQQLRAQLRGLLDRGFEPWPLRRLIEASRRGDSIPRTAFAVTFDDGYANNWQSAGPILRELNIPATIFLATAYLDADRPFPFDNWPLAGTAPSESWRPLTSRECQELFDTGLIDLGSHTHTHQNFAARPDDFADDLQQSLDVLRQRFGVERPLFSFPFGVCHHELIEAARRSGVVCALTTRPRLVSCGSDPFGWGRFGVTPSDTAATLAAKLGGWYDFARDVLQGRRRSPMVSATEPRRAAVDSPVTPLRSASP